MFVIKTLHLPLGFPRLHFDVKMVHAALQHTVVGFLVLVGAVLALQLVYPSSMTLPQTRIGGKSFGWRHKLQIAHDLTALNQTQLHIQTGDQELKFLPEELGVTIHGALDAEKVAQYSWKERLVPFSFFFAKREVGHFSYSVDDEKARTFALGLTQYNKPPANAAVKLAGTEVMVEKGEAGRLYEPTEIVTALKSLELTQGMTTTLTPKVVEPDISEQTAVEAAAILHRRLQTPLTIESGGKQQTFDAPTLAGWTVLTPDAANKTYRITYDREKVKQALAAFAGQVSVPAVPSNVTTLDGVITSTSGGAPGQALNVEASADAVIAAATENKMSVRAVLQPVVIVAHATHTYTRSSKGIQTLVNHWVEGHGGQYGIAFRSLDGGITASHSGDRQFTSASLYKIFVAYAVHARGLSMDAPTSAGRTVGSCLEVMIVHSSNACGHALGDMVGWRASDGFLHAKGFGATTLTYGGQLSSPQDTAQYLILLQSGSLASPEYNALLLSLFGRQIYRYGIPNGSRGIRVANKVGILNGYNHDVAIVYHPKGTYVLTVFSYGSSFSKISDLARQIAAVMSQ